MSEELKIKNKIEIEPKGSYFKVDDEGYIINPTSAEKVQEEWRLAIDDVVKAYQEAYGDKLKAVYVRGSVAKGEAIENVSDMDTFAYVDLPKEEIDTKWEKASVAKLKEKYPFVEGFELGAFPLSDTETREDQIFLLQSLCVFGEPFEVQKRKAGKDMLFHFPMTEKRMFNFKEKLNKVESDEKIKSACTWMMKNILRTGFELTMERSQKYTRDLYLCYKGFSDYYPEYESQMRMVLDLALNPVTNKDEITKTLEAIIPWMITECQRVDVTETK
ncbi:MAG: nucleotidyltransferase domain-containing protein [bacterium]